MRAFLDCAPGFDVNQKGGMSMMCSTPLHICCHMGDGAQQAEKISLLLERGAAPSLHTRNLFGFTPLSCLASNADGDPACVKLLVDAGAKVEQRDKPGAPGRFVRGLLALMAKTSKF